LKRLVVLGLAFVMLCGLAVPLFTGCSTTTEQGSENLNIVCTTYPVYDWVTNLVEGVDGVNVSYLLNDGVSSHSYEPSADDIIEIGKADLFIFNGGESEEWVESVLETANIEGQEVLCLMDYLKEANMAVPVPHIEGSTYFTEEEHEDDVEYDEHIWLSIKNAGSLVDVIAGKLSLMDSQNSGRYTSNSVNYIAKLTSLDDEYTSMTLSSPSNTWVFASMFPFAYMANDYGITTYAAFSGCSASSEVSFDTITFLSKKVDELGVTHVIVPVGNDTDIEETIAENTNAGSLEVVSIDTLHAITQEEADSGEVSYLSTMKNNLELLKPVFNQ
jgi:zinc transport system substrate-binding protein